MLVTNHQKWKDPQHEKQLLSLKSFLTKPKDKPDSGHLRPSARGHVLGGVNSHDSDDVSLHPLSGIEILALEGLA